MSLYRLKILTPEKKVYDSEIRSATFMCEDGLITVLARHAPMAALLSEGQVVIRKEDETLIGTAGKGVLQAGQNECAVMVRSFRWNSDDEEITDEEEKDTEIQSVRS